MTPPDLSTLIKARFVEAAHVARLLPSHGTRPAQYGPSWGDYYPFTETAKGGLVPDIQLRGAEAYAQQRAEFFSVRLRASADQITRHDECLTWMADYLADEAKHPKLRRSLWAFAFAVAGGRAFRAWCRDEGISHMTGYRRVESAVSTISENFGNSLDLLMEPAEEWVLRITGNQGINSGMVGDSNGRSRSWRAATADPAVTDDEQFQRIAEAQRRRREKLGIAA